MQKTKINPNCIAIILNWNALELTKRCIKSLTLQTKFKPDILVVDNNSVENPKNELNKDFKDIVVIVNPENYGVAGGRNIGIKYALEKKYSFILLFDNDAFAADDMIEQFTIAACNYPKVAIFGPKILKADQPDTIWKAGYASWKWNFLHTSAEIIKRFYRVFGKFPPPILDNSQGFDQFDDGQFDSEQYTNFQIGCAQFVRAEVFERVGLLDEELSPYGAEDIDFCARTLKSKWKIRYIPKARCWHRVESSYTNLYKRMYYQSRNFFLIARKNLTPLYFFVFFLPDYFFLTIPLMITNLIVNKKFDELGAFIKANIWNAKDILKRGIFLKN